MAVIIYVRKGGITELLAQAFAEGAREKGDIRGNEALKEAYALGLSIGEDVEGSVIQNDH